jgi:prepilin-type N-terminal cleavage/methylation domain-containing protein
MWLLSNIGSDGKVKPQTAHAGRAGCGRQGGFTLLELVVVIVIISMVGAVILPGLAASRSKSQQIRCANNVRELNLAFQIYTGDNGGNMVANNDAHSAPAWVEGFFSGGPSYATNLAVLNNPRVSLFAPYITVSEGLIFMSVRPTIPKVLGLRTVPWLWLEATH